MKRDALHATRGVRWLLWTALALIAFYVAVSWSGWQRRADLAAGLGARMVCSCRYVEGRDLRSCQGDLAGIDWMALVGYSDDPESKRVIASVPLMAKRSAQLKPGFGCLPERR